MNKKGAGNIILGLMFFLMGLVVLIMFISPMNTFLDIAQQSDNLNCKGYLHNGLNETDSIYAFNSSKNGGESGSPMSCLALKLYLPYILLIFLIAGISAVLAGKAEETFGLGGGEVQQY